MEVLQISKLPTKTIIVDVNNPRTTNMKNSLRQQEVKHALYRGEKSNYKPMAKYTYDNFGTMVNQHKFHKKPTVEKFI